MSLSGLAEQLLSRLAVAVAVILPLTGCHVPGLPQNCQSSEWFREVTKQITSYAPGARLAGVDPMDCYRGGGGVLQIDLQPNEPVSAARVHFYRAAKADGWVFDPPTLVEGPMFKEVVGTWTCIYLPVDSGPQLEVGVESTGC